MPSPPPPPPLLASVKDTEEQVVGDELQETQQGATPAVMFAVLEQPLELLTPTAFPSIFKKDVYILQGALRTHLPVSYVEPTLIISKTRAQQCQLLQSLKLKSFHVIFDVVIKNSDIAV